MISLVRCDLCCPFLPQVCPSSCPSSPHSVRAFRVKHLCDELHPRTGPFCSGSPRLAAHHFKPAFFQWLVDDEVNGNVSDSSDMAINRRAEVSVGITQVGSCSLSGFGTTFAILTMQKRKRGINEK